MELSLAVETAVLAAKAKRHDNYTHTVELRKLLTALSTGKKLDRIIKKYFPDSSDEEISKILTVTQALTPSCISTILQPIAKAKRSDITKRIESDSEELEEAVDTYYGERPLSYYLDNIWTSIYIHDPNAFEVVYWPDFDNTSTKAEPFPDLIACDHVHSYKKVNEKLEWLMVNTPQTKEYRFFAAGFVIDLVETDKGSINVDVFVEDNVHEITVTPTGLDEITANPIGNITDLSTNHVTYESFISPAIPRLEKLLKVGAEVDFAFNLHAMVKKYVIVQKCQGAVDDRCDNGCDRAGNTCSVCNGSGKMTTTSAKDVMEFVQPRNKEDMPDLKSLYHYEDVPKGIIDLELDYQKYLEEMTFKDVYNSTILQDYAGEKTAKEVSIDYEGIKDKLYPYEQQYCHAFKWHVNMIAAIRGEKVEKIICQFPMNLELEPTRQLVLNRKNIEGCPTFVVQDYDLRLAERTYSDSPEELDRFKLKQRYQPFAGMDLNTIKFITSSNSTSQYLDPIDIALWVNYDKVWKDIEDNEIDIEEDKIKELLRAEAEKYVPTTPQLEPVDGLG